MWPPKLPKNFPLTVTTKGYVVKIAGKTRWVCGQKKPAEALRIYERKVVAWRANDEPLPIVAPSRFVTLHQILTKWILDCRDSAERGRIRGRTYYTYRLSAKRITAIAGQINLSDYAPEVTKRIHDRLQDSYGIDAARRGMGHLRACFRMAEEMGWCDPVRFGQSLIARLAKRPVAKMKWRLYTPVEIRRILLAVTQRIRHSKGAAFRSPWLQMKAMILLAINGGYGAKELSQLPRSAIDIERGIIDHERGKTGAIHVVPLWPETVRALRKVLAERIGDNLVFRTRAGHPRAGQPWCRETRVLKGGKLSRAVNHDNVAWVFNQLTASAGLKIPGSSFYKLRHLFATTADKAGDPHAVNVLMGHALPGSKGHYIDVGHDRLRKVVEFVRAHLLSPVKLPQAARSEHAVASSFAGRGKR